MDATTVIFTQESWASYAADAPPLWQEHYDEVTPDHAANPLQLDVPLYQMLERDGRLVVLTARDAGGSLQGYAIFSLYHHPHFVSVLVAHEDHHFIRRCARGPRVGLRLVEESEQMLRAYHVHRVIWHTKPWLDNGRLFSHCGYAVSDILYSKQLDVA